MLIDHSRLPPFAGLLFLEASQQYPLIITLVTTIN